MSRAASSLESHHNYRSGDHLALQLVPPLLRFLLHISLFRRFYKQVLAPKGIYEYTIARTKYIDAVFSEILTKGVDQVLIFGAGFDTRALRFRKESGGARIFELDVPITQEAKLRQYGKLGLSIPANVEFIPIDFDKESLSEKLEESGFRREAKSLFVLEGLLMCLRPESAEETFRVLTRFAGEGSELVFDYVRASVLRQEGTAYGEQEILKSMANAGEQWHFGIEEEELAQFLWKDGWRVSDHKDALEFEQMNFTNATDKIVGRVNGTHGLVRAVRR